MKAMRTPFPQAPVSLSSDPLDPDYKECIENKGHVVSRVFCLPNSYRKDLPPPSKQIKIGQFCRSAALGLTVEAGSGVFFVTQILLTGI